MGLHIVQSVEHCSNFVEGSGGWWLAFVECASVKCRWNISSCINTTFLDFHQPLLAVIDFNLRLRILFTMFRISRLCPSVISIDRYTWKKQDHNSTDRDQFHRKRLQNVFSLPTKLCARLDEGISIWEKDLFLFYVFCVHSSEKTISSVTTQQFNNHASNSMTTKVVHRE